MSDERKVQTIKEIMDLLKDNSLTTSIRLSILLILYIYGKITFSELLAYTSLKKNTLYVNLQVLADNGLIKYKKTFSLKGIISIVEITPKGREVVEKLFEIIENIKEKEKK
ncbi:ArsR family transcriptional regulator [Sulfolobus sp. S-194]|uniref:transcriptional regulator n=1 Tax=Sulfolobus sp. S-194 TaxID=2512240 RepID=UPI001436DD87|nr:transcriptional regulator [Sulfolobus sp. S-194]QIW23857.1 ArsR family transcriptional regulator [Sulfolobus sp. S-194]